MKRSLLTSDWMTPRQRQFLHGIRRGRSLAEACRTIHLREETLARWLTIEPFAQRLALLTKVQHLRREEALRHAAAQAAELLQEAVSGGKTLTTTQHKACIEVVKLARAKETQPKPGDEAKEVMEPEIASPVVGEAEAEELRKLLG